MPSRRFKVVAGSVSVAVALGAGTSIAAVGSETGTDDPMSLNDVVPVSEVGSTPVTVDVSVAEFLASLDEDSFASPFDEDEVLFEQESPESPDESPAALEESPESPESPDDSPESPESPDDSPESPDDSPDESPESPDDSP